MKELASVLFEGRLGELTPVQRLELGFSGYFIDDGDVEGRLNFGWSCHSLRILW